MLLAVLILYGVTFWIDGQRIISTELSYTLGLDRFFWTAPAVATISALAIFALFRSKNAYGIRDFLTSMPGALALTGFGVVFALMVVLLPKWVPAVLFKNEPQQKQDSVACVTGYVSPPVFGQYRYWGATVFGQDIYLCQKFEVVGVAFGVRQICIPPDVDLINFSPYDLLNLSGLGNKFGFVPKSTTFVDRNLPKWELQYIELARKDPNTYKVAVHSFCDDEK